MLPGYQNFYYRFICTLGPEAIARTLSSSQIVTDTVNYFAKITKIPMNFKLSSKISEAKMTIKNRNHTISKDEG